MLFPKRYATIIFFLICMIQNAWSMEDDVNLVIIVTNECSALNVISRSEETRNLFFGSPDIWETIRNFFLPTSMKHFYMLRDYVAGDDFATQSTVLSPGKCVDNIYLHAISLTEGDAMESLLICSIALLPYHTFDAIVPILRLVITVPVSTESKDQYLKRLANIPSKTFTDSKIGEDKDKLTHFFGSAYLTILIKSNSLVDGIGEMIEFMESIFKLEGARDPRDVRANEQGIKFANALMQHKNVLPSDFFNVSLSK